MKLKPIFPALLLASALLTGLPVQACAAEGAEGFAPPAPADTLMLRTGTHEKYMDGTASGRFEPSKPLTRAQAAALVYGLLEQPPVGFRQFPDVPANAWYAQAASALTDAGLFRAGGGFRPGDPLTRAECALLLSHFLPPPDMPCWFTDVPMDDPACNEIFAAVSAGLLSGDPSGAFRPDDPLTRAEAAVVFNRLLGRNPDPARLAAMSGLRVFPDVPQNHWAYAQVMEASMTHECEPLEGTGYERWTTFIPEIPRIADGFHSIDGYLYLARGGQYVVSQTVGAFTFDAEGRYTTGNASLDSRLAAVVRAQTNDSMTRDQKLKALYDYVSRNFTYIKRGHVAKGQSGWEPAYADSFFADGRGNCFSFAAAFQQLARAVGVEARTVVGNLGKNRQVHGWVEIDLDGTTYVFDPELEMVYRGRGSSYNLFKITYQSAPFTYWK